MSKPPHPLAEQLDRIWHTPGWLGLSWSFLLHVATGVLAVAAHYALMALLIWAGMSPLAGSAIGFIAGAVVRFALSKRVVFRSRVANGPALLRFFVVLALQFWANLGLLAGLLWLGLSVPVAQLVTTAVLTVFNYLAHRIWVFR